MDANRVTWVDLAKGIGILLVVYGHLIRGLVNAGLIENTLSIRIIDQFIYSFHMPLFFFLAGLFVERAINHRGLPFFWLRKFDTVLYPYLLWSIAQGTLEVLAGPYTNGNAQASDVVALWTPRQQFWFLYALFQCLIFAGAIVRFSSSKSIGWWTLGAAVLSVIHPELPIPWGPLIFVPRYTVFVLAGVWWASSRPEERLQTRHVPILLLLTTAGLFAWTSEIGSPTAVRAMSCATAFSGTLAVVSLSLIPRSPWMIRILGTLGASSLAIYVSHTIFAAGTRIILQKGLDVDNTALHVSLGLAASVVPGIVLARLAQRHGMQWVLSAPVARILTGRRVGQPLRN